jgi:hypothetical protein
LHICHTSLFSFARQEFPAHYAFHVLVADCLDAVAPYLNTFLRQDLTLRQSGDLRQERLELPNSIKQLLTMKCCLCVTTMGRDEQLKKALPITIWLAWAYEEVTLYVVDFNQDDDLQRWVAANLSLPMTCGKLKYYRCRTMEHWHASLAKNTVHMAACRDITDGLTSADGKTEPDLAILVNLDGDNIFSPTWLRKLLGTNGRQLGMGLCRVIHYQNVDDSGTYGRMAYMSHDFRDVQGYDVSFYPMGCQDTDLNRLGTGAGNESMSIKSHNVGVSIPDATTSGDRRVDKTESDKARHSVRRC